MKLLSFAIAALLLTVGTANATQNACNYIGNEGPIDSGLETVNVLRGQFYGVDVSERDEYVCTNFNMAGIWNAFLTGQANVPLNGFLPGFGMYWLCSDPGTLNEIGLRQYNLIDLIDCTRGE